MSGQSSERDGDRGHDYELRYEISEHNAGRSCEVCREPADVYYWIEDELSTFRCSEHHHEDDELPVTA